MTGDKGVLDWALGSEVRAVSIENQKDKRVQTKFRRGSVVRRTSLSTSQIDELKEEDSKFVPLANSDALTVVVESHEPDNVLSPPSPRHRQNLAYWSAAESLFKSFKHKQSFRSRKRGSYIFLADELSPNPLTIKGTSSSFKNLEALFFTTKPETKRLPTKSAALDPRTSSSPNPEGTLPHPQAPNSELRQELKGSRIAERDTKNLEHSRRPVQEQMIRSKVVAGGRCRTMLANSVLVSRFPSPTILKGHSALNCRRM
jgi:hypothetical protein